MKSKKSFTLLELICVLTISLLVIGVVISRVGKTPAFISLDNCLNNIQSVLSEASNQAMINGKEYAIFYNNRKFSPKNNNISIKKYVTYKLPEGVNINFTNFEEDDNISYIFFPDGSASGPEMKLSFKKHSAIIKISRLTGTINIHKL